MKKYFLLLIAIYFSSATYGQVMDSTKRHVTLQGAVNFRDIGGYLTINGRRVKWGKLYRSANINKLTDNDLKVLRSRNINYDVDLRGFQESSQEPDRLNPGMDYILLPAGSNNLNNWMKNIAHIKGKEGDSLMIAYYSNIDSFSFRYKPFFDKLLKLPQTQSLVFHCTSGKDRTGIGAALLLYSIGVPYSIIMNDYLASNYYLRAENEKTVNQMVEFMHANPQVAMDMVSVKRKYLDATFKAIISKYGSIDNYLRTKIGLNSHKITLLKKKFLE